jgi:hypothetical protein
VGQVTADAGKPVKRLKALGLVHASNCFVISSSLRLLDGH